MVDLSLLYLVWATIAGLSGVFGCAPVGHASGTSRTVLLTNPVP